MFDINKVDRDIELFVFDVFIAIQKIKKVSSQFDNVQNLLHNFTSWDSVIREFEIDQDIVWAIIHQKLEPFENDIIDLISKLEPNLKKELIDSFIEDSSYLDFVVQSLKELRQ